MSPRPWIERHFELGLDAAELPTIIARLRAVPARLEAAVTGLPREVLTRRFDGAWSIQENAGHLLDLEPLGEGRLDELLAGEQTLTAADMSNRRTEEAGHNETSIDELLGAFARRRAALVARLEGLTPEDARRTALHPRLEQPMSVTDLFFFIAEHDDHHLERIDEIVARHAPAPRSPTAEPRYREMLEVALEEARQGLAEGGIPIGAALFDRDGTVLGRGHNRRVQEDDPSVHGETDAFRKAGRQASYRDTIMVTTLAPCWYCSGLVRQFRIGTVVVGESQTFQGGIDWLRDNGVEVIDLQSRECVELLGGYIEAHPEIWNEDIGESDG